MKHLLLFVLSLISLQSYATDFYCVNPLEPKLSYKLTQMDYSYYELIVSKSELVPDSCKSRWGCDYEDKLIYSDSLDYIDVQGASVFESKRTHLDMEDMDSVSYSYTTKNKDGAFVEKFAKLKCQ